MKTDRLSEFLIAGELSLSGELRPIKGALALSILAKKKNLNILLPPANVKEAMLVDGVEIYAVRDLAQAQQFLNGMTEISPIPHEGFQIDRIHLGFDFSEVKGQASLRRAVEVAVAGGHNLLIIGPPGSGKSMVAKRLPSILPSPTREEFLEVLAIHSAAGMTLVRLVTWDFWAADRSPSPARCLSHTTGYFSWTSSPNSADRRWKYSVSHWKMGW
jgi:magnesium chelatase family protein